jgi:16S rRNA (cytidine1402-2'-O)-methyltransferase
MARRRAEAGETRKSLAPSSHPDVVNEQGSDLRAESKLEVCPKNEKKTAKEGPADLPAGLYVVATPIGHAADITLRALMVLRAVDIIACEDTRVTAKLLALHGIARPLTRYDEHTAATAGPTLMAKIKSGASVALVSDAGTPLVSDPGGRLVRACVDENLTVVPIPGPSAVLAALAVAGLPTERFLFAGFPPTRTGARRRFYEELAKVEATLVVMEAPHRLVPSLADMAAVFGAREACVARELTKVFEEMRRGPLDQLARDYQARESVKGEVTIVVAPPAPAAAPSAAEIDERLEEALEQGSVRSAAAKVAEATGLPRKALYTRALELSGRRG